MIYNREKCRIAEFGIYYTYCNELSDTNPYELQNNCGKFKVEYVYNGTYFQQDA